MAKTKSERKLRFRWRGTAVFLLSFVGVASLVGFGIAHWTERQLLTTSNWVQVVGPLPKNDQVATALSDYSVNKLFENINVEQKITDALPEKASFLAPVLTDQLDTRATNVTKKLIQSDQFQNVWITANRTAHQRLVDNARGETQAQPANSKTFFNLNLSSLKDTIQPLITQRTGQLFDRPQSSASSSDVSLGVSLKSTLNEFKKFVQTVDFLNSILGILAVTCLLGAIVLTRSRRRLLLILSATIIVLALIELIAIKAGRPAVLQNVKNVSYQPAVGFIYDALLANFHKSVSTVAWVSLAIFIVTFLAKPKFLSRSRTLVKIWNSFSASRFWQYVRQGRQLIKLYRFYLMGAVLLICLVLLATVLNPDWQDILRALLISLVIIELISLTGLSKPTPALAVNAPKKRGRPPKKAK